MKKKSKLLSYSYDDDSYIAMLMEHGRSYDAAEYALQAAKEKLIREFHEKNSILNRSFEQISVADFFDLVFPDLDKLMVITSGAVGEKEDGTYFVMDVDNLVKYQSQRNDVYVAPCSFLNDCFKVATCKNIYAMVVDVDKVKPSVIENILKNGTMGDIIPMPTVFVNSGEGLHFYYVFDRPVPFFKKNRSTIFKIHDRIFDTVCSNIAAKADKHNIIQAFRIPGSLTKLDQVATGFVANPKWDIGQLARRVGADFDGSLIQLAVIPQKEYNELQKKKRTGEKCPKCGLDLVYRTNSEGGKFIGCTGYPECRFMKTVDGEIIRKKSRKKVNRKQENQSFYDYCLNKVYEKTEQGDRYMSMVALVIVAYKTGIEKEKVEEDLIELVEHYNKIGALFKYSEVKKAIRAYNEEALLTPSEKLEEFFGWEFRRGGKEKEKEKKLRDDYYEKEQERVYLFSESRRKQLEDARAIDETGKIISRRKYSLFWAREARDRNQAEIGQKWDDASGRKSKKAIVEGWQVKHPDGRKADCIRETGLSKPTVYKWWSDEIMN